MLNISNHPFAEWDEAQRADMDGEDVIDITFPEVEPEWDVPEIEVEAKRIAQFAKELYGHPHRVAFVDGETLLAYFIARELQRLGYVVVQVRTNRNATTNGDGSVTYKYEFKGWREWPDLWACEHVA